MTVLNHARILQKSQELHADEIKKYQKLTDRLDQSLSMLSSLNVRMIDVIDTLKECEVQRVPLSSISDKHRISLSSQLKGLCMGWRDDTCGRYDIFIFYSPITSSVEVKHHGQLACEYGKTRFEVDRFGAKILHIEKSCCTAKYEYVTPIDAIEKMCAEIGSYLDEMERRIDAI